MTKERKGIVVLGGIGNVSDKKKDLLKMFSPPLWVEMSNNSRSMDVVPVVEMLIVVEA
jgi:hypothetical protein